MVSGSPVEQGKTAEIPRGLEGKPRAHSPPPQREYLSILPLHTCTTRGPDSGPRSGSGSEVDE